MAVTGDQAAPSIQVLEGLEQVRRRAGMYVGGTDDILGLLWELLGNAVDEHLAGHGHSIDVRVDGHRIVVEDDGRGIPFQDIAPVFTTLHGAGIGPRKHRHVSPYLEGVGCAVTNALSSELVVTVWRDGQTAVQRFAK